MVIYVDELFLENFIMNYIILYITAYFSKTKTKWYRLASAAALGAIYVILTYIININIYNNLVFKAILSVLIVIIGFNFRKNIEVFKTILVFYLVTFAIGGAGFCIGYFSDAVTISDSGVIYVEEISLRIVIVAMIITFIMARILVLLLKNRVNLADAYFDIDIYLNNKVARIKAFLDTGNTVHEPYKKSSVVFVEGKELINFFPRYIYNILIKNDGVEKIAEDFWKKKIILIPVTTVNYNTQIRVAIRTEKIVVHTNEGAVENKGVAVVLCNNISKDGSYSALIGKEITKDK